MTLDETLILLSVVMAYPTLEDAIIEAKSWAHCTNDDCQCPTKEA